MQVSSQCFSSQVMFIFLQRERCVPGILTPDPLIRGKGRNQMASTEPINYTYTSTKWAVFAQRFVTCVSNRYHSLNLIEKTLRL